MSKRLLALLTLIAAMTIGITAQAEWVDLSSQDPAQPRIATTQVAPGKTVIDLTIPGFDIETVEVEGQAYARVRVPGHWFTLDKGQPELPMINSSLIIPNAGTPAVRLVDAVYREVASAPVLPSKGNLLRTQDPSQIPYTFSDAYQRGVYPAEATELGDPYILRDHRAVNLRLYPLRWDADRGVLLALESARLEVETKGSGGINVKPASIQTSVDAQYQNIYSRTFANFDESQKYSMLSTEGNLLIVCYDAFMGAIGDFVQWKREKGMTVEVISSGSVGGTTAGIKDAIQTRYDSPEGLTYVILVGDVAQIPTYSGTYEGADDDTRYVNLAGSDLYPDAFISRISASNPDDVLIQTQKFIRYERDPDAAGAWYNKAAGLASSEGSPADHERAEWLRQDLLGYGFDHVDEIYQLYGHGASQISAAVNEGRSIMYYIGHGSGSSWSNPSFSTSDVGNLSNGYMNPWILDVSCLNGDMSQNECFAEAWMRAGTTSQPNGAVSMYSASTSTPWVPPCVMQAEAIDLLVADQANVIGSLFFHGMMEVLDQYTGSTATQLVEQYNIFGDCTLQVRTAAPIAPAISHAGSVIIGSDQFQIDTGVAGATVSLFSDGVLHGSGVTDATGNCVVTLTEPVLQGGDVQLTVTGYNLLTYQEAIPAIVPVVVDIQPASIPVGVTTEVTVTLTDPPSKNVENVTISIEGLGVSGLQEITGAEGVAVFQVTPLYGETLTVRGVEAGASYNMFAEGLPVTGAMDLTNPAITAGVASIGLSGSLAANLEGQLDASADETGLSLFFGGGGITGSASDPGSTVALAVTPTETGIGTASLACEGYNIHAVDFDIVVAYGTVAGHVGDGDNGGANVYEAMVSLYNAPYTGSETPIFQISSDTDGNWTYADELPVGNYVLTVDKFGYLHSEETFFLMYGANDLSTSLSLAPAGELNGTLTSSEDSSPVGGLVVVRRADNNQQVGQGYADPGTGAYTISGLTYFDYNLRVTASGFIPQNVSVTIDQPSLTMDFVLEPTTGNILVIDDNLSKGNLVNNPPKLNKLGEVIADAYSVEGSRSGTDLMAALTDLGFNVTYVTSSAYEYGTWGDYDVVIMAAGDNTSSLSTSIKTDLQNFVAAGGKLLLEGGEVAYSHRYDTDFAQQVMHITSWGSDNVGDLTVSDPAHPVMSNPNTVTGPIACTYSGYGDSDSVTPAADADAPGSWTGSSSQASVVCFDPDAGPLGGQIVFFCFNYSAMGTGEREMLLHNAVQYLLHVDVGNGSIAGTVNVAGGDDSGVTVTLTPGDMTYITGPDGTYLFDGLYEGSYHITAVKTGWSSAAMDLELADGEDLTGLTCVLNPIVTEDFCDNPDVDVPDNDQNGGVYCPMDVPVNSTVSSVEVFLDITHTYLADLAVQIISPSGTVVTLHQNQGGSDDDLYAWYPTEAVPYQSLDAFIGEPIQGEWTLRAMDFGPMDLGHVNNWCLRFTYESNVADTGEDQLPRYLMADGNYPNPFNPMTTIKFALPAEGKVDVSVYDVAGRKVATVLSDVLSAGNQSVVWKGRDDQGRTVSSGTYFYRVSADGKTVVGKMLLMK
jgi:subtilisin-like proprotein convertase family protein